MSKIPQWHKDGWRPGGYRRCICPKCGRSVDTNALARARHVCPPPADKVLRSKEQK